MNQQKITITGWLIFLLVLYFASKSDLGYETIYYALALIAIFMVLVNYKAIQSVVFSQS